MTLLSSRFVRVKFVHKSTKTLIILIILIIAFFILTYHFAFTYQETKTPNAWLFTITVNGEKFRILVKDPVMANELRRIMKEGKQYIIMGEIRPGDGGFNKPWSWHLDPDTIKLAEITIELCDGTPSMIESQLDYWLNTVKRYCPWNAKVIDEDPWYG